MSSFNKIDEAFTELNGELQELAGVDFDKFCKLAGVNKKQAIVCLARARGLSFSQIEVKYKINARTAGDLCKKCEG